MKSILSPFVAVLSLFVAFVAVSVPVHAQTAFEPVQLLTGGTQAISAGGTSNYTSTVNVRRSDTMGVYTSWKLTGSGSDNCIFKFSKSADGSNFETTPSILFTNAANGTTTVHFFNAIDVTGVHTVKLASIVNGSSGEAMTNLTVTVGVKNR